MLKFVVRRLLLLIPILLGLSVAVFLFIHALPGDPASALLGERGTPEAVERLREQLGLDRPIYEQYFSFLRTYASGDFGSSIRSRQPIVDELLLYFPATVELALTAVLFASLIGIPLGVVSAKRRGSATDNGALFLSLIGISIPIFFLGLVLKYIFSVQLGWLPSVGRYDLREYSDIASVTNLRLVDTLLAGNLGAFGDAAAHLLLPAITLGSIPLAVITRITRSAVIEVLNEDYVRTARAKGLARRQIDNRHVLRNAMIPIATVIGLQTGLLLSGAILTERVFAWGGIGTWLYNGLQAKDYPVIQAGILFLAIIFVLVNLAVDVWYAFLNPRIRYSS
jgi:peptide/nickel transport system permease protein